MSGCPFHTTDDEPDDEDAESVSKQANDQQRGSVSRRDFVKSALLIGGTGAVESLGDVAGITTNVRAAESEPISAQARWNRQHAWDAVEKLTASGNTKPPDNSLFLMLDYQREGTPSPGHRRQIETALTEIERTFSWDPDGVLFTMAYSASYFDRFDEDLPEGAAPDDAETVAETVEALTDLADTNDDITPDTYDAMLLLASDNEANLLDVEAALWGESDTLDFEGTFEGIFERPTGWPDRRVGFLGPAFQDKEAEFEERFTDGEDIPDKSPLSMGFIAGFGDSMPPEENITLKDGQTFPFPGAENSEDVPTHLDYVGDVGERGPGVFAQGTLKHFSHLEIDLANWYDDESAENENSDDRRRHQMYSPYHDENETNAMGGDKPGSGLTDSNVSDRDNDVGPDDDKKSVLEYAEQTRATAAGTDGDAETETPTAGHSQKVARARYKIDGENTEQPVLRRDWDAITPVNGDETSGYLFNVPMRFNESVYSMLDANYNIEFTSLDGGIDHDSVENETIKKRSGIAPYMTATRRGNWLVPPITVRALPYPRAEDATISVEENQGQSETYAVEVSGVDRAGGVIDPETVRFGPVEVVNKGGGAEPTSVSRRGKSITFEFQATGLSAGDQVKLFGKKQGTRKPVTGQAQV